MFSSTSLSSFVGSVFKGMYIDIVRFAPTNTGTKQFSFLQLQRRFEHPVEHEHEMISLQAFGIGSCVIRSG